MMFLGVGYAWPEFHYADVVGNSRVVGNDVPVVRRAAQQANQRGVESFDHLENAALVSVGRRFVAAFGCGLGA